MFLGKKRLYKSLCISLCVVITLTIFHRGVAPSIFPEKDVDSEVTLSTVKRDTYAAPDAFWEDNKDQMTTESPDVYPSEWDIYFNNCTANRTYTQLDWFSTLEPNFQQFILYRHCRYFPLIINNPQKCNGKVDLLIVVKSIITQHDRRDVIRKTWGKEKEVNGKKIKTLFLLGTAVKEDERANYQKLLEFENQIYGDILQWDFLDTFFNLTLKEVHFLKWMTIYCHQVSYIFKGDDDIFVSPTNILEFLDGKEMPDLFVGDVLYKARPIRRKDNKYYIPASLYNKTHYPPYAGGGGFIMSRSLVKRLFKASEALDLYPIDDVFLGMCLELIQVKPIMHDGFKTFGIARQKNSKMNKEPCFFQNMIVVHKLLPAELLHMWELVHSNLTCSRKFHIL
ncbi:UDP-GlcNAc:betaGal beta-1,3-N-acetylglucosaminyltransferase 7 [Hyperolius riggenbachi]|uniref:UDP-GlcNAc:betaGal beta-1,3-N-acetylglucosaminyltransferase 7 n=1 Tax=Hyperolius riggenbachi TaxID=752182 RepID=UPI0035A30AF7